MLYFWEELELLLIFDPLPVTSLMSLLKSWDNFNLHYHYEYTMNDARRVIGSYVQTKAKFVTHISECNRRFGSNADTKLVDGVVYSVEVTTNPATNRQITTIHANWALDPNTIIPNGVNIRSVKSITTIPAHIHGE